MAELVRLEIVGNVGIIRLDRPPVNAINSQMHGDLAAAARAAAENQDVRSVLIYGGEKAFAAGADIKEMAERTPSQIAIYGGQLTEAVDAVARIPKPVIAAVIGYALGGGCELALAADFRVVAEDALLGLPEITLGVIPGAGGTQRLPRLIGVTKAKEMIFGGRPITGVEAVAIGLASRAAPADRVYDVSLTWAKNLATGATAALGAAKSAIDNGLDGDLATGLRWEATVFAGTFATEDQKTGMRSFIENGPGKATFAGR